jgi:hypothetical protein
VFEFDLDAGQEVERYVDERFTANFGDVQRLPGGNMLVTYSNAGVVVELDSEREPALEITAAPYLGYVTWCASLYGPDPPGQ